MADSARGHHRPDAGMQFSKENPTAAPPLPHWSGRGAPDSPTAQSKDPIAVALVAAAAIHALLILGVSFEPEPRKSPPPDRTLEIMVVRHPVEPKDPKEADFLAQTSQQGGGTEEERVRPTTEAAPSPLPEPLPDPTPQVQVPALPEPPPPETTSEPSATPEEPRPSPPAPEPVPEPPPEPAAPKPLLTNIRTPEPTPRPKPAEEKWEAPKPPQPATPKVPPAPKPKPKQPATAADILASTNAEIDRLTAELDRKTEAYAKRPRRAFISASTKEYKYAAYMESWRQKVERIGNLNYPADAKQLKLYGSLILDVTLNPQGAVTNIEVRRSSGERVLDDAAINIVRLASPFAPFPPDIKKEVDLLHITRTWQFRNNNQLFAK